jgi:hypothetical protein
MLTRVDCGKCNFDEWMESRRLARREICADFEVKTIIPDNKFS